MRNEAERLGQLNLQNNDVPLSCHLVPVTKLKARTSNCIAAKQDRQEGTFYFIAQKLVIEQENKDKMIIH